MPFPTPKLETIKSRYLLSWLDSEADEAHQGDEFDYYFDKSNNQAIYEKYIKVKSAKEINISAELRGPLDKLAVAKKWSAMSTPLKAVKDEVRRLIQTNTVTNFAKTPIGQKVLGIASIGLEDPKAKLALGLVQVYIKPRRPDDKWEAYQGLQKLASKAKVDALLKGLGLEPMTGKPVDSEAIVAKNAKEHKFAKQLIAAINDGLKYYKSALAFLEKNGVPSDPEEVTRMFESGRRRHDKVHLPYNEVLLRNKALLTKYKDIEKGKKELDEAWGAYRTKLQKR